MIGWLKTLFGSMDRQTVAAERAAKALEDIATDLEGVRDQLRERLGIAPTAAPKALVTVKEEGEAESVKGKRSR